MTTIPDEEIVFDPKSGISVEEQRDILTKINGIAEKNRLSLSSGSGEDLSTEKSQRFKAQKSGRFFPIVINCIAILALAGGVVVLSSFQGKTDAQVREGEKVYNSAERALIEEIRKETSSRLEAKEREISLITSKLASIDAELRELYSNNTELSVDQQAVGDQLRATQDEYLATLAKLQDERSLILEESRTREAILQTQLENRTRELINVSQQSATEINFARDELDRLITEQAQSATVDAQMNAFFTNLNNQLTENRFEEASSTLNSMKIFLDTPAFKGFRSIQSRRELYTQTINSFETMIRNKDPSAMPVIITSSDNGIEKILSDLQERNAQLEQNLAERDRTIATASNSQGNSTRRIVELEASVNTLQNTNNTLQAGSSEKDNQIRSLQNERNTLNQTISTQTQSIATLTQTIATRNNTITARDNTISRIREVVQGRSVTDMTLGELNDSLVRIQNALNE
jgi:chromosome segregation ATPase